jgi:hypothetical protein
VNLKQILSVGSLAVSLLLAAPAFANGVAQNARDVTSNGSPRPFNPTPSALPHWPGVVRTQFQDFVAAAQLNAGQIEAVRTVLENARLKHKEMSENGQQPLYLRHFDNAFVGAIKAKLTNKQFRIFAARIGSPFVFASVANQPPRDPIMNSQR